LNTDKNKEPKTIFNLPVVFVVAGTTFLVGFLFLTNFNNPSKDLLLSNLNFPIVSNILNTTNQVNTSNNKIHIIDAVKINENQQIIENIFEKVKTKDDNWATLENNQYIRITFEEPLTNRNDITIYARNTESQIGLGDLSPSVQVFAKTSSDNAELVAEFTEIKQARSHKALLTNLRESTDTFYLKTDCAMSDIAQSCGILEIDYITDPTEGGITVNSGVKIGSGIQITTGDGGGEEFGDYDGETLGFTEGLQDEENQGFVEESVIVSGNGWVVFYAENDSNVEIKINDEIKYSGQINDEDDPVAVLLRDGDLLTYKVFIPRLYSFWTTIIVGVEINLDKFLEDVGWYGGYDLFDF
jgi:hypothetical protein